MIRAQSAIVGAAPLHGRIEVVRHLRRLQENLAAAAVIIDIVGNQDALTAMDGARFQQIDTTVFEDDLAVHAAKATGADGDGDVIKQVRSNPVSQAAPRARTSIAQPDKPTEAPTGLRK